MAAITVLGGTGYAGSAIVREAAVRGHTVVSVSRTLPDQQVPGVRYVLASLLDPAAHVEALAGAEVVISALSPRGALREHLLEVNRRLAQLAGQNGARSGVVGGFSALRPAAGAPRFAETQELPPGFAHEVQTMTAVLVDLESGSARGRRLVLRQPRPELRCARARPGHRLLPPRQRRRPRRRQEPIRDLRRRPRAGCYRRGREPHPPPTALLRRLLSQRQLACPDGRPAAAPWGSMRARMASATAVSWPIWSGVRASITFCRTWVT